MQAVEWSAASTTCFAVSAFGIAPNNAPTQNPWKKFGNALKSCAAGSAPSAAAGGAAVAAGTNALSTAGKFAGMTPGTSLASSFFRAVLPQSIEATWAPTLMNPLATSGVLGVYVPDGTGTLPRRH